MSRRAAIKPAPRRRKRIVKRITHRRKRQVVPLIDAKGAKLLVKALNGNFGPPFLPEGFVRATYLGPDPAFDADPSFELVIGPRDVQLGLDLKSVGSGTLLTNRWEIKERKLRRRR